VHVDDPFVQRARREGWRSRAVYKLAEIQERDRIIRQGMTIVDLGAAPGAWSQYAARILAGRGRIVALDLLPMDGLAGVEFIQGDFREPGVLEVLDERLGGQPVDLVLSDMAPNISGVAAVDQPRSMHLAELALDFANQRLAPGGALMAKYFQGEGAQSLVAEARRTFDDVRTRKPKASRTRSREVFLVARNHRVL
jgi:23S rRNA (uridine2552-2'-O)-methyltransferase